MAYIFLFMQHSFSQNLTQNPILALAPEAGKFKNWLGGGVTNQQITVVCELMWYILVDSIHYYNESHRGDSSLVIFSMLRFGV